MADFTVRDRRSSAGPSERRDPTAATSNVMFVSPGRPQITEWNADYAIRLGYLSQIYVYRCVQKIATDIASLAFRVGADPDKPGDYNVNAPMAKHLGPMPGHPNPELTSRVLLTHSIAMYLVTGRWAWEIDRGGDGTRRNGEPVGLWPLAVQYMEPHPTSKGTKYFDGYSYYVQGQERQLRTDQVMYAWKPSLADVRQPESVLQAARLNVDVASMLDQYSAAFLRNNATPATAVVTEAWATGEDRDAFQAQFNGAYGGVRNAGRTAFLEANGDGEKGVTGMFDIKTLGLSQKDAQFEQQARQKISDICVAFGVPLSKLGDASGRTFANADQEDYNYWTDLLPTIKDVQDHINLRLAPQYGSGSDVGWFDLSNVKALKPHRNLIPITVSEARNNDIITNEEAREFIGVPGTTAGITEDDQARAQYASVGLSRLAAAMPALVAAGLITEEDGHNMLGLPGKVPDKKPVPDTLAGPKQLPPGAPQPALPPGTPASSPPPPDPQGPPQPVDKSKRDAALHASRIGFLRAAYARQTRRLLERQADSVHRWLAGKRGQQLVSRRETDNVTIYDRDFWADETRSWATDLYETAVGVAAIDDGGSTYPPARAFVAERSARLADVVTGEIADVVLRAYLETVGSDYDHAEVVTAVDGAMRQYVDAACASIEQRESELAYAGALRSVQHVNDQRITSVLAQLAAGDMDIDAATVALQEGAGING